MNSHKSGQEGKNESKFLSNTYEIYNAPKKKKQQQQQQPHLKKNSFNEQSFSTVII